MVRRHEKPEKSYAREVEEGVDFVELEGKALLREEELRAEREEECL